MGNCQKCYVIVGWQNRRSRFGESDIGLTIIKYPKDEDHCWTGVSIENAENCWVRRVNFKHFAGSAVIVQKTGSKTTVEDCVSTEPVSEIGGMRRSTFYTMGAADTFQRCYSKQGIIHDFSADFVRQVRMLLYSVIRKSR